MGVPEGFIGPEFLTLRWQVPVRLGGRTVYLDALDPDSGVNFEVDGAKYHAGPQDRERDLRRDASLAALGIIVIRFTHYQLVHQSDWVRGTAATALVTHRRGGWCPPPEVRLG